MAIIGTRATVRSTGASTFNLARDEDVELLGWLLAIPRSCRTRAIKAVLQAGLPAFVAARHRARSRCPQMRSGPGLARVDARGADFEECPPAPTILVSTGSTEGPPAAPGPEPDPAAERSGELVDPGATAEARLDRLLQSFR